ncbi:MAG: GNAT family N-acetyltransferase [Candidatus Spyradocola sp.]|jgi:ribosomal protein S18 acetylase RimI-like enzyme
MRFEEVKRADEEAIRALSALATAIIREHFDPLIGKAQNDYMLEKFQSVPALCRQLEDGYRYFFVCTDEGMRMGFLAFYPKADTLYLSKFYLKKEWRGKGLAWEMLRFVREQARAAGLPSVTLNVNRDNSAVCAYERMGFVRIREEKNDIGSGFFMDDFVYQYSL